MSVYRVTRNLKGPIRLVGAITIAGVDFVPRDGRDINAIGDVTADRYRAAAISFDQTLLLAMDALAVVTGAAITALGSSTLVEKRRSKYVYLHAIHRRKAADLTLAASHHAQNIHIASDVATRLPGDSRYRNSAAFLASSRSVGIACHVGVPSPPGS
jgi:hypothetical protein